MASWRWRSLGAARRGLVGVEELRQRTLRLSRLLKLEFSYRVGETFEAIFDQTLAGLKSAGLVGRRHARRAPGAGRGAAARRSSPVR